MNAKCNDFSVCNEFLYVFTGKTALGLLFLVFCPFFVSSIFKENYQWPFLTKCSVFPVIRPLSRLIQAFLPYLWWFRCYFLTVRRCGWLLSNWFKCSDFIWISWRYMSIRQCIKKIGFGAAKYDIMGNISSYNRIYMNTVVSPAVSLRFRGVKKRWLQAVLWTDLINLYPGCASANGRNGRC